MKKIKLSVVLAVKNEEKNLETCIQAIKGLADEIIVVDDYSTDKTREIARELGAQVIKYRHKKNFHENKQLGIEKATGDWILQLDADERVTPVLKAEIEEVIGLSDEKIRQRKFKAKKKRLFQRHQKAIERRDGPVGKKTGEIVAFFLPRLNIFLGQPLKHAGVYPDGVIRLIKKGKAYLPAKSVHEQVVVEGEVAWLENDLEHHDSPSFGHYLNRANQYTGYTAEAFEQKKTPKNIIVLFFYSFIKPLLVFLKLYLRHKGFLDGMRGFVWSLFSALHFPIAYFKYWIGECKIRR